MLTADDMAIPEDVTIAVLRASTTVPAQVWDLDTLKAKAGFGRRIRAWLANRRLAVIIAGAVATLLAGSTAAVLGTGSMGTPGPSQVRLEVFASGPHLYAAWRDCSSAPCSMALLGSDDGGTSWTTRIDWTSPDFRLYPGPEGSLLAEGLQVGSDGRRATGDTDLDALVVSGDGGLTWKSVVDTPEPWTTTPPGILGCAHVDTCRLSLTDPTTGRSSPLPVQPPFAGTPRWTVVGATIWLDTNDGGTLGTSSSSDGAKTWTSNSEPCPTSACNSPLTAAPDGATVYRVQENNDGNHAQIQRSTNAGATWQAFDVTIPSTDDGFLRGLVTADGTLIALSCGQSGGAMTASVLGPSDTYPRSQNLTGLPDHLGAIYPSGVSGDAETGYLIQPVNGDVFYRSSDGLAWHAIRVPMA